MSLKLPIEIIEAYAFANTPAYLYRKLSANEYVAKLAVQKKEDLFRLIDSSNAENLDSIALAYAALIALLRKNIDPLSALELPAAQKLEWAPALISLFRQKVPGMSVTKIKQPTVSGTPEITALTPFTVTKVPKHD